MAKQPSSTETGAPSPGSSVTVDKSVTTGASVTANVVLPVDRPRSARANSAIDKAVKVFEGVMATIPSKLRK